MRVVIIGGTGHVGTYLVPRLVEAGHSVANLSRSQRAPYQPHPAWRAVEQVAIDRAALEARGEFGRAVAALAPDVVIDMICFSRSSAAQLVDALRGRVEHLIHCGTIWVHGHSVQVPTVESQHRKPFGEYGQQKLAIEEYLLNEYGWNDFPATVLHPGHIVGPGWIPVNPAGNFNPVVFTRLTRGGEVALPNLGMETLHHVHADDVAEAFMLALEHREAALGEAFHVASPAALTLRGYAEEAAAWFGQMANLHFLPWDEWKGTVTQEDATATWDHIAHSPNVSIAKAERLLGYRARYSSLDAVREAVGWLIDHGRLQE